MMKQLIFSILIIFLSTSISFSQELRCNISVNANKLTGSNKNIFRSMQTDLYEFMNNKRWTKFTFSNAERIECSITIQVNKQVSSENLLSQMLNELNAVLLFRSINKYLPMNMKGH